MEYIDGVAVTLAASGGGSAVIVWMLNRLISSVDKLTDAITSDRLDRALREGRSLAENISHRGGE